MFGFDDAQNDYNTAKSENTGSVSHEVVAGGAAFFAMHEFEKHQRTQGETVDHSFAKEALAGLAGAGVDYLAETKGEDFVDKERAKHEAKKKANQLYDQHYGGQDNYDPNNTEPPQQLQEEFGEHHYKKKHRND